MRQFGLIGKSLKHSFSQQYFTEKFAREGIKDCSYHLFPLEHIEELPNLLHQHPALVGLNVTIPYKHEVLKFVTDFSHLPEDLPAANCLRIQASGIAAYNTDVIGFEQTFTRLFNSAMHGAALVLGNGGAAKAVKFVLKKLGVPFLVVGRSMVAGTDLLYSDVDAAVMSSHPVIVNTTPLGTYPDVENSPPIPYEYLTGEHYLYDLVYNPEVTTFLQHGIRAGAIVQNGYGMLVAQAEASWKIWNDQ